MQEAERENELESKCGINKDVVNYLPRRTWYKRKLYECYKKGLD